jgi:hypothetical protein
MGILDELLGGGQRQKDYKDFVDRYEQGDPSEGYSDQEVLKRYGEVSHAVPPDQFVGRRKRRLASCRRKSGLLSSRCWERAAERGAAAEGHPT